MLCVEEWEDALVITEWFWPMNKKGQLECENLRSIFSSHCPVWPEWNLKISKIHKL